jgi:predicted MFS family arabinose efflux permease
VFVGGVFLAESAFYAVVPPLVPGFVRDAHMTTSEVGVLVAAYPAGVLIASLPAIALVGWRGVRTSTIAGLATLVAATLGFAWGNDAVLVDASRLVQGMGGAIAWAGALAWLTSEAPARRRASVIGGAVGVALIGMVLGPAIGALASQVGRGAIFSALAGVLAILALAVPPAAPAAPRPRGMFRSLGLLLVHRHAALGNGLLLVIGVVNGTVASLVPLLVTRHQGSAAVIAVMLAGSYLIGAFFNVVLGRVADRVGRLVPILVGLLLVALILPAMPVLGSLVILALATVIVGAVLAGLWTPTAAMVTDGADSGPSGQAVAVATLNAAWAAGLAAGAVVVSRLADSAGFEPPFILVGGLCAAGAIVAAATYRRGATHEHAAETRRAGSTF